MNKQGKINSVEARFLYLIIFLYCNINSKFFQLYKLHVRLHEIDSYYDDFII